MLLEPIIVADLLRRRDAMLADGSLRPAGELARYCYEDYEALEGILGASLVLRDRRRIDDGLFRPGREGELVRALLEPCRDLAATARAVASDARATAVAVTDEEEEDEDDIRPVETP